MFGLGAAAAERGAGASRRSNVSQAELKLSAISDLEAHITQLQQLLRGLHAERDASDAELERARARVVELEREASLGVAARAELGALAEQRDALRDALVAAERERDAAVADGESLRGRAQQLLEHSEEQEQLMRTQTAVPFSLLTRLESSMSDLAPDGPRGDGAKAGVPHARHEIGAGTELALLAKLTARDQALARLQAELALARGECLLAAQPEDGAGAPLDAAGGDGGNGAAGGALREAAAVPYALESRHSNTSDSATGVDADEDGECEEGHEEGEASPQLFARASMAETKSETRLLKLRQQAARALSDKVSGALGDARTAGPGHGTWGMGHGFAVAERCALPRNAARARTGSRLRPPFPSSLPLRPRVALGGGERAHAQVTVAGAPLGPDRAGQHAADDEQPVARRRGGKRGVAEKVRAAAVCARGTARARTPRPI